MQEYKPLFPNKKKSKRTGKTTFAMVGFAPTSRRQAPYDDKDTIIAGLNEGYVHDFMGRWDLWFQMHSSSNFMRPNNDNDRNHSTWVSEKKDFPILMQRKYEFVPSSVEYPLEHIKKLIPEPLFSHSGGRYLTSTAAFMLAFGILEGFERIEIFGFEMGSNTEYFYQKPCFEFWMGLAAGMGIEVYLPPVCGILRGPLYGYEKMSVGYRQKLEMRKEMLVRNGQQAQWDFHKFVGRMEQTKSFVADLLPKMQNFKLETVKEYEESMTTLCAEELKQFDILLEKQKALVNRIEGARLEMDMAIKFYDEYPFEEDEGDRDVEEETDTRSKPASGNSK